MTAKLAACVNIYPPMTSIYDWDGKMETATEVAAFIKTRRVLVDRAIDVARPLHPYTLPCFLVLPIDGGNDDYLVLGACPDRFAVAILSRSIDGYDIMRL